MYHSPFHSCKTGDNTTIPNDSHHFTVEKKEQFAQLSAAVKFDFRLEIQSLPKCLFLNVFSITYRPAKVNVLGTWEVSVLFRNLLFFFFVLYRFTLH